ncbi:hypothetical protein PV328_000461 [Microctonus aethiopoides]|uniref:Phorbol-ester/DAG-type domain-containing protein n=1 Tax=Microctonus aethiopoides TaxID=144406 RepID=A0AA39FW50_9HYME|nr:hypothetical protein PV328_000461 [Microctonus aethiopoides]
MDVGNVYWKILSKDIIQGFSCRSHDPYPQRQVFVNWTIDLLTNKELFGASDVGPPDGMGNRKMSNGSTGSTKHKWLKAFKSLKTSSPTTPPTSDKKSLESEGGHQWREYTYRKITPCDACGQVLRGHSRQGLRCRGCKVNAHADCINLVQPANCPSLAPKRGGGIPLLRRQRTPAPPVDDLASTEHSVDATYQVLKQAGEIRGNSTSSPPTPPTADHPSSGGALSSRTVSSSHPCSSSTSGLSGGCSSGTRPSGQPLVLMSPEPSPSLLPRSPLRNQNSGKKIR